MPQGTGVDVRREAARALTHHPPGARTPHYEAALQRYLTAVLGASSGHDESVPLRTNDEPSLLGETVASPAVRGLGEYHVADVMTHDVAAVPSTATFHEVLTVLQGRGVSCAPVIDEHRRVVGVVSMSDLLAGLIAGGEEEAPRMGFDARNRSLRRKAHAELVAELMTSPAVVVTATTSVVSAARAAARARVHQLPVIDAHGRLVGIVARSDLMGAFLGGDDEIRAYIHDHIMVQQFCFDPASIEVTVSGGVVGLVGQVERAAILPTFLHAVRSVAGVVNVHSHLTVPTD
jgi:CBS-domain-containing membrane protein